LAIARRRISNEKEKRMIEIYGTTTCSFCLRAKKLASRHNIAYEYKNIEEAQFRTELDGKMTTPYSTVPQIFWHGKYIGGYDQLNTEIENTRNFGDGAF
jgi:glutaredoxin 1